ncbi:hypothetical protein BGZ63DRAFT_372996 [Mariannaea sp. PMI_226]|nr:hypothetical protein BGZ63DRAFT_372996 [Mariannaea sp. PMI_226]
MSTLSPVSNSAEPSGSVSPPSYASTPVPLAAVTNTNTTEEKIAYEKPIPEDGIEVARPPDNDGADLPEVVPEGHIYNHSSDKKPNQDQQEQQQQQHSFTDSKVAMNINDQVQNIVPPEQVQTPPPPGYNGHQPLPTVTPPVNQQPAPIVPPGNHETVTPLHLLGDQSDTVDCPFCRRRTTTEVRHSASSATHFVALILFFVTFCGVVAPYMLHWSSNISHWCRNCNRKVAYRNHGSKEMVPLGTPDHLREVSKFQPAQAPVMVMNPNAAAQA